MSISTSYRDGGGTMRARSSSRLQSTAEPRVRCPSPRGTGSARGTVGITDRVALSNDVTLSVTAIQFIPTTATAAEFEDNVEDEVIDDREQPSSLQDIHPKA